MKVQNKVKGNNQSLKNWIFFLCLVVLPLIQFFIFYICVNFNSILLSFKVYSVDGLRYGFDNYEKIFLETETITSAFKNSGIAFASRVLVGMSLGVVFSYYIFRGMPASNTFKVLLFLPTIVSSVVMVIMYRLIVEGVYPYVTSGGDLFAPGLLSNDATRFGAILFYNIWVGFGTQVLLYLGAMNGISVGSLEACKIDGANMLQEFFHVVFPGIFNTFVVFITVNIAEFFTNQMALHAFYGFKELGDSKMYTLGYYMYREVGLAMGNEAQLGYPAALGILCTLIAVPLTFIVKYALRKLGPSVD